MNANMHEFVAQNKYNYGINLKWVILKNGIYTQGKGKLLEIFIIQVDEIILQVADRFLSID